MQRLLEDMDETHPGCASLVLSNRPEAGGLAKAQVMGVATEVLDHRPFGEDRARFETELHKILKAYQVDVICLAGFMRILGTDFVSAWRGRMLRGDWQARRVERRADGRGNPHSGVRCACGPLGHGARPSMDAGHAGAAFLPCGLWGVAWPANAHI